MWKEVAALAFLEEVRDSSGMDKAEHGRRLKLAIAQKGYDRETVADLAGATPRTVTNWTNGSTEPSPKQKALLRKALGEYDNPGDPVEVAVKGSRLTEDRQYAVIGVYKKHLREQDEDEGRRGA